MLNNPKTLKAATMVFLALHSCAGTVAVPYGKENAPCFSNDSCSEGLTCNENNICEQSPNLCDSVDCSNHGICRVENHSAACSCDDGYHSEGLKCVADSDPCDNITCSGHGICIVKNDSPTCHCESNYHPVDLSCQPDQTVAQLDIGITSSLDKVYSDAPIEFEGTMSQDATLSLARREYEAIQLVVFPAEDLTDVSISVGDLLSTTGSARIPSSDICIDTVGYVNLLEAKVDGDRLGWIPDPLFPNQALDLTRNKPQAYLITVWASETLPAGEYHGSIDVAVEGNVVASVSFTVTIWDFTLPLVPRFKTANFAGWSTPRSMWPDYDFTDEQRRAHMTDLAQLGFRNRLPPTIFFASGLSSWNWNGDGNTTYGYPTHDGNVFNAQRTDELIDFMLDHGANHFFLGITSDIFKLPNKIDARRAALVAYLTDYRDHLLDRGLMDMVYVYNVDEAWGAEAAQHARDTYTLIKNEVGQDIRILQNSNENTNTMFERFLDYFDAFDINLGFYDVNDADNYRQTYPDQFTDFWWNVNIWPDVHPNLFLEYPLFDARIIGPMSFVYRMQGFEYWQVFTKASMGNYHPVHPDELFVKWDVDHKSLDGCLVYPSDDLQIFSSLRYESFRDGMEDQEYLYILKDLDPDNPLLQVPIITGLNTFSRDQDEVLDFRKQVAEAIISLQ